MMPTPAPRVPPAVYARFLLLLAGVGGLLYGIDVGIISAALLYLGKTITLSLGQTSAIVAAVFGGSMAASLVAGVLADWFGRRTMMIVSGLLFVLSVGLIVVSQGFVPLFVGRLLQGMSGGVIAVVVPLYLAESLPAKDRGKGAAVFQLMLTVGIVLAALTGLYYTGRAEAVIAAAGANAELVRAAQDHAWRGMFLSVVYPGLVFFVGSFFLTETPRWLYRRGRVVEALGALRRASSEESAQQQMREMEAVQGDGTGEGKTRAHRDGSLLQRRYVVPFVLACIILACNQATGINSILPYLSVILKQAGLSAAQATQGDFAVKLLNMLMTVVAVVLVDRKGRKFLLVVGTSGIIVALSAAALIFHDAESGRADVRAAVQSQVRGGGLNVPVASLGGGDAPRILTVLYSQGAGEQVASVLSTQKHASLQIMPAANGAALVVHQAKLGPVPTEAAGRSIAFCLALFIAAFAVGPGVVVWLTLSELMPTRIRSAGMGIALLLNQGVSTGIAAVFLPVVGNYGYAAIFGFWAACTVVYLVTAAFFLPETKGKTLEEIELGFAEAGR